MYGFVDTTESASNASLMSLTTIFNGVNLDEFLTDENGSFTTISTTGRSVPTRRIKTIQTQGDGVTESYYELESREITVKYRIKDKANEGFRERYNKLNSLLRGSKKVLEFTDEEAFYFATLLNSEQVEEDSNDLISTLVFLCSDPSKYSLELSIVIDPNTTKEIKGHKSTFWKTRTIFSANQSGYELTFNSLGKTDLRDINKIELNYNFLERDILEIDYSKRKVSVNGQDITNTVIISQSNFIELPIGDVEFEASHKTELFYNERYY